MSDTRTQEEKDALFAERYPEHAKFEKVKVEAEAVSHFISAMIENHDEYVLAKEGEDDMGNWVLIPAGVTGEQLVGEHFGIDHKAFSEEKDLMLQTLREHGDLIP